MLYSWNRYWAPIDSELKLDDDGGFFYKPDSEFGKYYNPTCKRLEDLIDIPCLILLGEPGSGKSVELDQLANQLQQDNTAGHVLHIELGEIENGHDLHRKLDTNTLQEWRNDGKHLTILFDSLDEGLLEVRVLASRLVDEITALGSERLSVRITCRTSDWPPSITSKLTHHFGKSHVQVFRLVPLRREDVVVAAEESGIEDSQAFLRDVIEAGATTLAAQPISLQMLLDLYRKDGELPASRSELFRLGIELLCRDNNNDRRERHDTGTLSFKQRFVIAARIAAFMIVANRHTLAINSRSYDSAINTLLAEEIGIETESIAEGDIRINQNVLKEVLNDTSLFHGYVAQDGGNRYVWAHRSYAEFLAAWYLNERIQSPAQLHQIFIQRIGEHEQVVPQLRETSAWLSGMNSYVRNMVLRVEPEVLLYSDAVQPTDNLRREVTKALIERARAETLTNDADRAFGRLAKLNQPSLGEDLRQVISDESESVRTRSFAIHIAHECDAASLSSLLCDLALNSPTDYELRVDALRGVSRVGSDSDKRRIRSQLLRQDSDLLRDDRDDQLRGYALRSLWPEYLTATELFSLLDNPKREFYYGSYQGFINYDLLPHLTPADLPVALQWVLREIPRGTSLQDLAEDIMLLAWDHWDTNRIRSALLRIIVKRFTEDHELFNQDEQRVKFAGQLQSSDDRRRIIVDHILKAGDVARQRSYMLPHTHPPLLLTKDVNWLIECYTRSRKPEVRRIISHLLVHVADFENAEAFEQIYYAAVKNTQLMDELRPRLSIQLGTDDEKWSRQALEQRRKDENKHERIAHRQNAILGRIIEYLLKVEQGDTDAWYTIDRDLLTLDNTDQLYENVLRYDRGFAWPQLSLEEQERIIEAARRYVGHTFSTHSTEDFKLTAKWHWVAARALYIINDNRQELLTNLTGHEWQTAIKLILAGNFNERDEGTGRMPLAATAYRQAGKVFVDILANAVQTADDYHLYHVLRHAESCWDEAIAKRLMQIVQKGLRSNSQRDAVLAALLKQNYLPAQRYAVKKFKTAFDSLETNPTEAISLGQLLINNADSSTWPVIWRAIQASSEFGRDVMLRVAYTSRTNLTLALTDIQLSELYIWLCQKFPIEEDPEQDGVQDVTARDQIADLRRHSIESLVSRGTVNAIAALRNIARQIPNDSSTLYYLREGLIVLHRNSWNPITPQEFLRLTQDNKTRLVRDAGELRDVVIESLERLQSDLQGEHPAAEYLWDQTQWKQQKRKDKTSTSDIDNKSLFRPKEEEAFSTWIARHLRQDLISRRIVIGREVEIRRVDDTGHGQYLDLQVSAALERSPSTWYETASVIIEVKGQWNPSLAKDMKAQLVHRYLKRNPQVAHGIYVVGYFFCDIWDDRDSRKAKAKRNGAFDDIRIDLAKQAQGLSTADLSVASFVLDVRLGKLSTN